MSSFVILCYYGQEDGVCDHIMDVSVVGDRQKTQLRGVGRQRILVLGRSSPLLEGVVDLLQLSGYEVEMSSSSMETAYALQVAPPNLAIVDISGPTLDAYRVSEQIRRIPHWTDVPILFISFSGDDRIRDLQRWTHKSNDKRLQFYAHTVLSMDGLLNKVGACLA
jgi:CheY-like chemotaxis protein